MKRGTVSGRPPHISGNTAQNVKIILEQGIILLLQVSRSFLIYRKGDHEDES